MNRITKPIKDGFIGVTRNWALSLSSISSVTITLLLMGFFLLLSSNVDAITVSLEQNVQIHVLLDYEQNQPPAEKNEETAAVDGNADTAAVNEGAPAPKNEQVTKLENQIKAIPNVRTVDFSDKDTELEYYIEWSDGEELYGEYRGDINPMHDAFLVSVEDGKELVEVADQIRALEGVSKVNAGGAGTETLMSGLSTLRNVGFVIVVALAIIAIFLIANTIRVSIHSRRREITIMRNVGATNWYIRWPFIVEGMIIGLIGALIPVLVTIFGYSFLLQQSSLTFFEGSMSLLPSNPLVYWVSLGLVILGMVVGAIGSVFSVGKYLRWTR